MVQLLSLLLLGQDQFGLPLAHLCTALLMGMLLVYFAGLMLV